MILVYTLFQVMANVCFLISHTFPFMLCVVGTTLEELRKMFNWSAHQITNETLRALFKNGFTSCLAIAQIRESDLRYLRRHTDINPGQTVLLRGVIENISKEYTEVRVAETQTLTSEQGASNLATNASESPLNVSSECEQIVDEANRPTISKFSDSQNNEGTLNTNIVDTSREQAVMLPQERQNEKELNQVLNQSLEMSGTVVTEQAAGQRAQITINSWNSTTLTQSNSSTLSSSEIDEIDGIFSQLDSNQNIPSDQTNCPADNAFHQSFTTQSNQGAEGNSGSERSGLERAQVNTENEALRLDPILSSIGKNKDVYTLRKLTFGGGGSQL